MDYQHSNLTLPQSTQVDVLLSHLRTYVDAIDSMMSDFNDEFEGVKYCTTLFALRRLANAEQRHDSILGELRRAIGSSLGQPDLKGLPGESRVLVALGRAPDGSADQHQYERQTKALIQSWLGPFLVQIAHFVNAMSLELDLIRGWFTDPGNSPEEVHPRNLPRNRHGNPIGIYGIREFEFQEDVDCVSVLSTAHVRNRLFLEAGRKGDALALFDEWTAHAFYNGDTPAW